MTLNYVIPANIVMEIIMIGIQSAVYNHSYRRLTYAPIDQIYLGFVVPFFLGCFGWLMYFKESDRVFTSWSRAVRAAQGVTLFIGGALMIWSAELVEDTVCKGSRIANGDSCQLRELKITAGTLALVDGVFYFLKPCQYVLRPLPVMMPHLQQPIAVTVNVGSNQGQVQPPPPVPWYAQPPPPPPPHYMPMGPFQYPKY